MAGAEVTVPVTAGSIALANSIVSSVAPGSIILKLGLDTYKWIQRMRISEASFEKCMTLARGLAYPNAFGRVLEEQLEASATSLKRRVLQAPLDLALAGSLDRALIKEIETSYLVTTVAVLAQSHDLKECTDYVTDLLLRDDATPSYLVAMQRAPVRVVVDKIVESIYLHVINPGHHGTELPPKLKGLCPHYTNSRAMASIIRRLSKCKDKEVVIRSPCFIEDLTLWCLTHYHGRVVVSITGTIEFDDVLGDSGTTLRLIVDKRCGISMPDGHDDVNDVLVDISMEDTLHNVHSAKTFPHRMQEPKSLTRHELYALNSAWKKQSRLNREDSLTVLATAKRLTKWLLNIPVIEYCIFGSSEIALSLRLGPKESDREAKCRTLSMLCPRSPHLFQLDTGDMDTEAAPLININESSAWRTFVPSTANADMTRLIGHFPLLGDLTDRLINKCKCTPCERGEKPVYIARSCLRYEALTQIFTLIAHAICDAAGVDSVAGTNSKNGDELAAKAVAFLFNSILETSSLCWQAWIGVISETAAGFTLPERFHDQKADKAMNTHALQAIQYGSLSLIASWMQISKPFEASNLLGVLCYDAVIKGLPDDTGLVFAENIAQLNAERYHGREAEVPDQSTEMQVDETEAQLITAMFRTDDIFYRQITTIQTTTQLQLIDPAVITVAQLRSSWPTCDHTQALQDEPTDSYVFDFEQGLARMNALLREHKGQYATSTIMTQALKANVLAGESWNGAVVRDTDRCCLRCARTISDKLDKPIITVAWSRNSAMVLSYRHR